MWELGESTKSLIIGSMAGAAIALASVALAQEADQGTVGQTTQSIQIETLPVRGKVQMIAGAGQNIAVQTGSDGTLVVNAGTAGAAGQVLSTIRKLTAQPIRYVMDTSADPAVVGGNAVLAKSGRNIYDTGVSPIRLQNAEVTSVITAAILASPGTLFRVSAPTGKASPYPNDVWPTQTFETDHYYVYFNDEAVELYRVAAHDDTDMIVFFRGSDVIAAGSLIDADRFPVIDVTHGGSIQGEIAALNRIIDLSDAPIPFIWRHGGTYIIPGNGRIYQQADVVQYRDMLVEIEDAVQDLIKRHMTLRQIEAVNLCLAYAGEYGRDSGPWTTNDFVQAIYQSLTKPGAPAPAASE